MLEYCISGLPYVNIFWGEGACPQLPLEDRARGPWKSQPPKNKIPWLFTDFNNIKDFPWIFPDLEKFWYLPAFSLTVATLI